MKPSRVLARTANLSGDGIGDALRQAQCDHLTILAETPASGKGDI
jgi:hypothetical protein